MNDMILRLVSLKAKGFCCAQAILILGLEAQGKINVDLVRSMAGLCYGINWSGEVCGALSGGACLLSLHSAKGTYQEAASEHHTKMLGELVEWFTRTADEQYGGTRCNEVLEKFPDRSMCAKIVADTYQKCMDILSSHGFDPAVTRKE